MAKKANRSKSVPTHLSDVPRSHRLYVLRRIHAARGYAAFNVVHGTDQNLRGRATVEHDGEDGAMSFYERTKFANLARQGARNSETLNTILKQFEINVVGTVGGKASFVLEDQAKAARLQRAFGRYCRSCEYFDRLPLSVVLKKAMLCYLMCGDIVLMVDRFSKKLVSFEPDCINSVSDADFAKFWPSGWTQRQGRVYNEGGQFCGVICSHSQRGKSVFDVYDKNGRLAVFFLRCDPNGSPLDEDWVILRNVYRLNQGRGTPQIGSALGSILDLEDVTKYEVQAAKHNAQTIGQIYQTGTDGSVTLADGLDPNDVPTDWNEADEEAVREAVADAQSGGENFTFDEIRGAGVIFNKMPSNAKMELLDTKHPNQNMPEFIRWLAGRSAASLGLGSVYATMKADASYTAFRGEQVMSWPAFEEMQKQLEGVVCDWVLARWAEWAPEVADENPGEGWTDGVTWQWPKMREVDQVNEQTAIEKKLKNFTGSFREVYGPQWRERLGEIAEELAEFRRLGLPHPSMTTVSGAQIAQPGKGGNDEDV